MRAIACKGEGGVFNPMSAHAKVSKKGLKFDQIMHIKFFTKPTSV